MNFQTTTETQIISSYSSTFPVFISIIPENVFNGVQLEAHGFTKAAEYFMGNNGDEENFSWTGEGLNANGIILSTLSCHQ